MKKLIRPLQKSFNVNYFSSNAAIRHQTQQQPMQKTLDPERWQIEVALIIHRLPIIAPPMTDIEREFSELSQRIEHTQSYKCDFELRMEKDAILIQKRKKLEAEGKDLSHLDEQLGISSFQLFDEWKQKAARITKAYNLDQPPINSYSKQSPMKNLDRKLILAVKQKFPDALNQNYISPWTLPQFTNQGEETLKKTAQKWLNIIFSRDSNTYEFKLMGNAPIGHFLLKYSHAMRKRLNRDGSVIFFYPVQFRMGNAAFSSPQLYFNNDKIVEHKWCTKEEFDELIYCEDYKKAFNFVLKE